MIWLIAGGIIIGGVPLALMVFPFAADVHDEQERAIILGMILLGIALACGVLWMAFTR